MELDISLSFLEFLTENSSIIQNIIELSITILALMLSIYATVLVLRFRHQLSFSEQIANIPNFLNKRYLDREIKGTKEDEPKTLKEARDHLRKEDEGVEAFKIIQEKIGEKEEKRRTWHNKYAYEASLALQNIGLMLIVGAIPIKLVLSEFACIIIEDWRFCQRFIEEDLRSETPLKWKSSKTHKLIKPMFYSRRHAEWLAYASALYLHEYWEFIEGEGNRLFALKNALSLFGSVHEIRQREHELRRAEELAPKNVMSEIDKFLRYPPSV